MLYHRPPPPSGFGATWSAHYRDLNTEREWRRTSRCSCLSARGKAFGGRFSRLRHTAHRSVRCWCFCKGLKARQHKMAAILKHAVYPMWSHSTLSMSHLQMVQGRIPPAAIRQSWASLWQQDMQRRDFTVNALMYDPFSRLLFDYVGGLADCRRRKLHCIGNADESMDVDPFRALRGIRLSARTGQPLTCCTISHCCKVP